MGAARDPAADPRVLCSEPRWALSGGARSCLPPQAPFCAVPKVASAPLQVPQQQAGSPGKSPRHPRTMMMSAAAPWARCHEDALAMPQSWGHVCGSVAGPCPQEGVALPTEVIPPCPALQEKSSCVGIFLDFNVNFPFFLLKPKVVRDSLPGLGPHSGAGTSIPGTSAIPWGCEAGSGTTETSLGMWNSRRAQGIAGIVCGVFIWLCRIHTTVSSHSEWKRERAGSGPRPRRRSRISCLCSTGGAGSEPLAALRAGPGMALVVGRSFPKGGEVS